MKELNYLLLGTARRLSSINLQNNKLQQVYDRYLAVT